MYQYINLTASPCMPRQCYKLHVQLTLFADSGKDTKTATTRTKQRRTQAQGLQHYGSHNGSHCIAIPSDWHPSSSCRETLHHIIPPGREKRSWVGLEILMLAAPVGHAHRPVMHVLQLTNAPHDLLPIDTISSISPHLRACPDSAASINIVRPTQLRFSRPGGIMWCKVSLQLISMPAGWVCYAM